MTKCLAILILFFLVSATEAQGLSTVEKQLTAYLSSQRQAELRLLERLVNISSGTLKISGVEQVGKILQPQWAALGFKTYWVEEPAAMHRAGTLVAQRSGRQGKKLLLIGHLDTVFDAHQPFRGFKQRGEKVTGPGVIDDKGGVVVLLYALKALAAVHALDDTQITVVLTGDEEDSGKPTALSRKPLFEAAKRSELALDFEWALSRYSATIARRGVSHWRMSATGKEAHSSEIFQAAAGDGAIFELSRILDEMRRQLSREPYLSFSPGLMLGGTQLSYQEGNAQGSAFGKSNVIATVAMAQGDLRFLTEQQKQQAQQRIQEIVAQHLPGTQASLRFQEGIPAMPPTPGNMNLLKQYSEVSQDLGYGEVKEVDPGARGAGDISHVASFMPANLAGLGPVGSGAHSPQETLDLDSLLIQTQRAAVLMYRLTRS